MLFDTTGLAEGAASHALPPGTLEGINDWKRTGYGGAPARLSASTAIYISYTRWM